MRGGERDGYLGWGSGVLGGYMGRGGSFIGFGSGIVRSGWV